MQQEADEALERLNERPVTVGGLTLAPREAMEGLLLELSKRYLGYLETTPLWKLLRKPSPSAMPWIRLLKPISMRARKAS